MQSCGNMHTHTSASNTILLIEFFFVFVCIFISCFDKRGITTAGVTIAILITDEPLPAALVHFGLFERRTPTYTAIGFHLARSPGSRHDHVPRNCLSCVRDTTSQQGSQGAYNHAIRRTKNPVNGLSQEGLHTKSSAPAHRPSPGG